MINITEEEFTEKYQQNPAQVLMIIREKPTWLRFVKNQTEELCIEAIKKNITAFKYVKNQTYNTCTAVLDKSLEYFKYIKEPTLEIKKYLLSKDGTYIKDFENPSEELIIEAVKSKPESIFFISKPSEKVLEVLFKYDGSYLEYYPTENVELQKIAIANNILSINFIKEPCKDIILLFAMTYPEYFFVFDKYQNLKDLVTQDEIDEYFENNMAENFSLLRYISKPSYSLVKKIAESFNGEIEIPSETNNYYNSKIIKTVSELFYNCLKSLNGFTEEEKLAFLIDYPDLIILAKDNEVLLSKLISLQPVLINKLDEPSESLCITAVEHDKNGNIFKNLSKESQTEPVCRMYLDKEYWLNSVIKEKYHTDSSIKYALDAFDCIKNYNLRFALLKEFKKNYPILNTNEILNPYEEESDTKVTNMTSICYSKNSQENFDPVEFLENYQTNENIGIEECDSDDNNTEIETCTESNSVKENEEFKLETFEDNIPPKSVSNKIKKKNTFLSFRKIVIGCVLTFLFLFCVCFFVFRSKAEIYKHHDYSYTELHVDEKELTPVYIPKKYKIYDLSFVTDEKTLNFKNATYKEEGFFNKNIVVNIYSDCYTEDPVGFYIFPKKEIKCISGIVSEETVEE